MIRPDSAALFEERRRHLLGLAYRILGSLADAEDPVQETFLKWRGADVNAIDNPAAWLTTACTRHCLDLLKSARRKRVDYVGTWLPEPVHTVTDETPESSLELASSLSTAFLLLLERLSPKERAAYLLHDIFDRSYEDVATSLGLQEATCRKLVSRARASVGRSTNRYLAPRQRQEALLSAFQSALLTGEIGGFAAMLSDDVSLCSDGGGKVPTLQRTLRGKGEVLEFIMGSLRGYWSPYEWRPADINGGRGVLLISGDGHVGASVTFGYDAEGRLADIYIVRNPDKLAGLEREQAWLA
jgi:RNA polymerase sigma factor (sigma-70 family)